jgi:molybdopterin synthase catalytic subunit
MSVVARLLAVPIDPQAVLGDFLVDAQGAGAVVTFSGLARATDSDGGRIKALHLDHYPGMTEASLQAIADEGARRFDVSQVLVLHRCGTIAAGEMIVFVAAAAAHRRAAFLAADFLMDKLKTEAVFWKKEEGVDGSRWIEPTDADRADRARWSE